MDDYKHRYLRPSPAVANGVVYETGGNYLYAFDAKGNTNCSGTPTTCSPRWSASVVGEVYSSPAVANGMVYVGFEVGLSTLLTLPG